MEIEASRLARGFANSIVGEPMTGIEIVYLFKKLLVSCNFPEHIINSAMAEMIEEVGLSYPNTGRAMAEAYWEE